MTTLTTNGKSEKTRRITTRRAFVGATTTALIGGGALAATTRRTQALELGEMTVPDAERELDGAPSAVAVDVDVTIEGEVTDPFEQVQVTLNARVDGTTDELAQTAVFDVSGTFEESVSLSGDLLDHGEVSSDGLDAAPGESESVTARLTTVASGVRGGNIVEESTAYDDVTVTVLGGEISVLKVGATGVITVEG